MQFENIIPSSFVVISNGCEPRNGGVGDDHVLPRRPGLVHLTAVLEGVGIGVGAVHSIALAT